MAVYVWGDVGDPLPVLDYACRDESWLKYLPSGAQIVANKGHGSSYWSQAVRIEVRLPDDSRQRYFLKLSENELGRLMCQGEFESLNALYKIAPQSVPRPIGWGTYSNAPDLHFFLCDFVDIIDERYPSKTELCSTLAAIHRASQTQSPNGKFGFHVPTCNGTVIQTNDWTTSWEEFYIAKLKFLVARQIARHGDWPEYTALEESFYDKVCVRLLRPLETEGRLLRPTLLHADVWHGNTATQARAGDPMLLFDASSFWGHNEYEVHSWRGGRYLFGKEHIDEYFKHYPPSEPVEDVHDRNLLYFLSSELHCLELYPKVGKRQAIIDYIRILLDKYPDGYTGKWKRRGENGVHDKS